VIGCRPQYGSRIGVKRDDARVLTSILPAHVGDHPSVLDQGRASRAEIPLPHAKPTRCVLAPDPRSGGEIEDAQLPLCTECVDAPSCNDGNGPRAVIEPEVIMKEVP